MLCEKQKLCTIFLLPRIDHFSRVIASNTHAGNTHAGNTHAGNTQDSTPLTYAISTHPICLLRRSFSVNFTDRTCSCVRWQDIGIPCGHAITAINTAKQAPMDLVPPYPTRQNCVAGYDSAMPPITMDGISRVRSGNISSRLWTARLLKSGRRGSSSQSGRLLRTPMAVKREPREPEDEQS